MAIPKGTSVRQVLPAPVEGVITGFTIDQETGEVLHLVEWTDADGHSCSRYFKETDLVAFQ